MMVIAATSKVPFYIAGGLFALWAVSVSTFGINRPSFPGGAIGQRGVILVSLTLAALAIAMAIVTA